MKNSNTQHCTAFEGQKKLAQGPLAEVAISLKESLKKSPKKEFLIFDDVTSQPVEIDLRGSVEAVLRRLEAEESSVGPEDQKPGPGRPKLGVLAKEITLLPQHWEWLSRQPGGASVTLRKLVDEAKKKNVGKDQVRATQESIHRFMTAMAGNLEHYEDALRALYAKDEQKFKKLISVWPKDIRAHTLKLAKKAF